MNVPSTKLRFPTWTAAVCLTGLLVVLAAGTWLILPMVMGESTRFELMIAAAFGSVWLTGIACLATIAVVGPLGPMPTIYAFLGGMLLRMAFTMGLAMLLFHRGMVPGTPLAVCLAIAYLPALAVEVAFVGRFLWSMDMPSPPSDKAGQPAQVMA